MKVLIDIRKQPDLPLSFILNNRELTIPFKIANDFNSYFAAIGRNNAAALDSDHIKDETYSTYLNTPHRSSIRSGLFQTANDLGGVGGFKTPPLLPLRSRKLLCQSLPYHKCAFYQVF